MTPIASSFTNSSVAFLLTHSFSIVNFAFRCIGRRQFHYGYSSELDGEFGGYAEHLLLRLQLGLPEILRQGFPETRHHESVDRLSPQQVPSREELYQSILPLVAEPDAL